MTSPSLALCIPAYNAGAYLPRLLESALTQTIPFDQILVYDDCSTDNSSEVAARYGAQVVRGKVNRGCSHGKNVLAEQTTCEWIHFHDADDALHSKFVETAHKWMGLEAPPDIVLFDYEWRKDETDEQIGIRHFDQARLQQDPIAYAIQEQINPFCGLYRRSAYLQAGGYDTDPLVLYNEDVAFHLRMAISGLKFAADPTVTVINYQRVNSMSAANQIKCARAQFHVMKKTSEALQGRYNQAIARRLWEISAGLAYHLDWAYTDRAIDLALQLSQDFPINISPIFRIFCSINPYFAHRFREKMVRFFKPQLRQKLVS